jgi:hypothetical protein
MAFVKRRITLQFQLGQGSFGEGGSDTIEVSGVRCSASMTKGGGVGLTELNLRVFGLNLDVMNKLTILGKPLVDGRHNTVVVSAGDEGGSLSVVFAGTIIEAWVDARNSPQVAFLVTAQDGALMALKPVIPVSFKGSVDAATVVSYIAQQAGMGFENGGVSVQLDNPYLPNTALEQLQSVARAGQFNCIIETFDTGNGTVVIWPYDKPRPGRVPVISPETGLVGYPMRTQNGIQLQTLFNPAIIFGGQIQVKSELTPANGGWTVFRVSHDLEAETPGGKWFTTMECSLLGQEVPVGE